MKNIFDPKDNQEIIARIHNLTPESKALWGKMSVDQMVSHCIAPINVALGTEKINVPIPGKIDEKIMVRCSRI